MEQLGTKLVEGGDDIVAAMSDALQNAEFPDLRAIVCAFTKRVGGAEGVARLLWHEYKSAKPGTMIRSMILQMILQGSKAIAAKEQVRDESMMSDQDIERECAALIEKAKDGAEKRKADRARKASPSS